jgi:hypothetical protein
VRLVRALGTVVKPLLDGTILFPSVVSCQDFDSWHAGVSEDFVFFVENGYGFFGLTIFLANFLLFIVLGQEGGFFDDVLVLLDQVSMAGRKSRDFLKVLLVSLVVNPRVNNLHFLGKEFVKLLFSETRVLSVGCGDSCLLVSTCHHAVHAISIGLIALHGIPHSCRS